MEIANAVGMKTITMSWVPQCLRSGLILVETPPFYLFWLLSRGGFRMFWTKIMKIFASGGTKIALEMLGLGRCFAKIFAPTARFPL